MQSRQRVEQVKSYFIAVATPHNTLHEIAKETKGCRLGRGKSWMGQAEDSTLQVWQLTELKQTKSGKYTQTDSGVSMRHSCQKICKITVENGQQAKQSEIKLLIQENRKPQDLIVYTDGSVTKDHSGWGFAVKQGVTTIPEDSAAYSVSTSSLTMEVEAVTHALRWIASRGDSQTTLAVILTDSMNLLLKVKSGMGSPDWNVSVVDIHLRRLRWVYCPGQLGFSSPLKVGFISL